MNLSTYNFTFAVIALFCLCGKLEVEMFTGIMARGYEATGWDYTVNLSYPAISRPH